MNWKEEYYNELFNSDTNIKKLKKLAKDNGVKSLFKYRNGSDYDILNLKSCVLPAVKPRLFNDPYECDSILCDLENFKSKYTDVLGENYLKNVIEDIEKDEEERHYLNLYNDVYKSVESNLKTHNICCFSENKDNILMWSHYANNHKGFCIEYRYIDIAKSNVFLCPVLYKDSIPYLDDGIAKIIYTKANNWEYECEWRIYENSKEEEVYFIETPVPLAIYIGCRASLELYMECVEYCKENSISLYIAEKNKFKYKLDFKKVI